MISCDVYWLWAGISFITPLEVPTGKLIVCEIDILFYPLVIFLGEWESIPITQEKWIREKCNTEKMSPLNFFPES